MRPSLIAVSWLLLANVLLAEDKKPPAKPAAPPQGVQEMPGRGDISIALVNLSPRKVYVVLDNEREAHLIDPAYIAIFHLNIGDQPAYHVYAVNGDKRGNRLWSESSTGADPSRRVSSNSVRWTGSRLEHD